MAARLLRIVCVGKLKTACWKEACAHYSRLIGHWRPLELVEVKDGDSALDARSRIVQEGGRLLARLSGNERLVALHERGKSMSSPDFAELLKNAEEKAAALCFIIGGPYGLADDVIGKCPIRLSLSRMTLPHELARVLLLEQIYRAESITRGLPYHH